MTTALLAPVLRLCARPALLAAAALLAGLLTACGGGDDSPAAVAPTITAAPAAITVTAGQSASFTVVATGSALTYTWRRDGNPIVGASAATYTLTPATLADTGALFSVTVSNAGGSVESAPARLTVNAPLVPVTITAAPTSMSVAELQTVTLTVSASGTPPLFYQWQRSTDGATWSDIAGATADRYTTPKLLRTDNGSGYRVIVNNAANAPAISAGAQLTVAADAAVLLAQGGTVSGDNDNIRVTVPPGALLGPMRFRFTPLADLPELPDGYQLVPNTAYIIEHEGEGLIAGARVTVTFRTPAAPATVQALLSSGKRGGSGSSANDGRVVRLSSSTSNDGAVTRCTDGPPVFIPRPPDPSDPRNTDAGGALLPSDVALCRQGSNGTGSTGAGAVRPLPSRLPGILTQPNDQRVAAGGPVTFSVLSTGPGQSYTYQWFRNGVAISGATSSAYMFTTSASDNGARFTVRLSNAFGTLTSREATLTTVAPQPSAWSANTVLTGNFAPDVGAPKSVFYGAVYNDAGTLRALDFGSRGPLAANVIGDPVVLGGPNLSLSVILFLQATQGQPCDRRLMAVGVLDSTDTGLSFSAPFVVYESTTDCPSSPFGAATFGRFQAGFVTQAGQGGTVNVRISSFWFSGLPAGPLVAIDPTTQVLARNGECSGGLFTNERSMAGVSDGHRLSPNVVVTEAALAFVVGNSTGGTSTCAATMAANGTWSTAQTLMDNGPFNGALPTAVTAMDGAGNALVAVSTNNGTTAPMGVAYRPVTGTGAAAGGWQIETPLPGTFITRPAIGFDANGVADLFWRSASGGGDAVFAATRSASGAWSLPEPVSTPGQSILFARPIVAANGGVVVLFQQRPVGGTAYTVWEATREFGVWKTPVAVQTSANAGSDHTVLRFPYGSAGTTAYWREADPMTSGALQIMRATKTQ
jgi:hypothetical protein